MIKGFSFLCIVVFLVSCGSYNRKIQRYYTQMEAGRYSAASRVLDNIKFLHRPRNQFLYYAEKGRMAHLMGLYDSSNYLLNEADRIAETRFKNTGDLIAGNLLNPMMQTYRGEAFERFMLHYYKALNYSYLGDAENALVEARRISIATNEQMDRTRERDNRFSRDAFSLNIQGMIYEAAGDLNNAFIAYRNASETYLSHPDNTWYGVRIPSQLQKDLIRTAHQNGFTGIADRFERQWNISYQPTPAPEGGELVLFIETGKAPVKEEENLFFTLLKGEGGSFYFADPAGNFQIPFDLNRYNTNNVDIGDLRTFRVALPRYSAVSPRVETASVTINGMGYTPELAEDINTIAFQTMRENRIKDITEALTRLAIKKIAEAGLRAGGKAIANNKKGQDKAETPDEKKKQEEKAEAVGAAMGLIFQAFSLAAEKADTRNWQSLPAHIQYIRAPLQKGVNKISVQLPGARNITRTLEVEGKGGLQFVNIH
ncbi:MAG TPA: hypothetical protein PK339_01765 [Flavitalea sp.]|nr:hypothetical protein [Flavitalea sp.]